MLDTFEFEYIEVQPAYDAKIRYNSTNDTSTVSTKLIGSPPNYGMPPRNIDLVNDQGGN